MLSLVGLSVNAQTITSVSSGKAVSIRGLSVVDDNIAWVSGSRGTVGTTTDGGKTWNWQQVKGFEKSDFRDIEAFSGKDAIMMSSGTPAIVLKTTDGGINWTEKYRNADSVYFLDAMDFANDKRGFIMGDPIGGKFLLMETKDGGETWAILANAPVALKDEAAFAASGTCLRVDKNITIVTGGGSSRILTSAINKLKWTATTLPLTEGSSSRGAFSLAKGKNQTIVVGGNYAKDKQADSVAYLLPTVKASYKNNMPVTAPAGFQSSVEYIDGDFYLSTGTSGSNFTADGGKTWSKISATSYNVCRKAKRGRLVLFAGDRGNIGVYKP